MKSMYLSDELVARMANLPEYTKEFPFIERLKQLGITEQACQTCSYRKNKGHQEAVNSVKAAIAGLADERRLKLKQMLNVESIKINYTLNGRHVTTTI